MGIFSDDIKPRVTKEEFREIRSTLSSYDFTTKELNRIEEIFRGDMYEDRESDNGIDENELKRGIAWMKEHESEHMISQSKIDLLEEKMMAKIKKA